MIAAPTAKRPRITGPDFTRKELARIGSILDDDENIVHYKIWPDSMNTLHFKPRALLGELSNVARLAFGYNDPHFVRAPVFLPLQYTAQLTDSDLTKVLLQANCAALALRDIESLHSVSALIATLAPHALNLAAPPEHDVILHMSARGLEVEYASQSGAGFVVPSAELEDHVTLAARIVQEAQRRYADQASIATRA